eukprot:5616324-Pleurochrysis_carterae.AAC.1
MRSPISKPDAVDTVDDSLSTTDKASMSVGSRGTDGADGSGKVRYAKLSGAESSGTDSDRSALSAGAK